jgi:hypothetical protein
MLSLGADNVLVQLSLSVPTANSPGCEFLDDDDDDDDDDDVVKCQRRIAKGTLTGCWQLINSVP